MWTEIKDFLENSIVKTKIKHYFPLVFHVQYWVDQNACSWNIFIKDGYGIWDLGYIWCWFKYILRSYISAQAPNQKNAPYLCIFTGNIEWCCRKRSVWRKTTTNRYHVICDQHKPWCLIASLSSSIAWWAIGSTISLLQLQWLENKFSYFGIWGINQITGLPLLSHFIPLDGILLL